ncbi:MAG TPA: nucleotidyltransferase [Saprospiraceae bacterium]|nr:nucleotidyltransferase [Saprospiraceae bacterium]
MELTRDYKEFIELLKRHEVNYLIVGGYAVNLYGYPRYTDDLDIWIWVDSSNIRKLLVALKEFGFNSLNLSEEDFNSPENVLQLGYAPNRIDLLVEIEGLKFEACFDRRTIVELDQIQIDFIGLDDLIEAKKNTGRLQDLADADQLEKLKRKHQNKA